MKNNIPECPICFKNCFETLLCRTPCAHKICMDCMLVIQKYECPTCRGTLPIMNNLRKARNLFVNNEKEKEEISVYNNDDFPPLGS